METHEKYMLCALEEGEKCRASGDVPVGCIIVKDSKIIAPAHMGQGSRVTYMVQPSSRQVPRALQAAAMCLWAVSL